MVVTNHYRRNPAKDAIEVVDNLSNANTYVKMTSFYTGEDAKLLDMAISAISTSRGLNSRAVLERLHGIKEKSELERKSLGSGVTVKFSGKTETREIVDSAYDQNTLQGYNDFLKNHAGDMGVTLAKTEGIKSMTDQDISKLSEIRAQSGETGLESSSSWLNEF